MFTVLHSFGAMLALIPVPTGKGGKSGKSAVSLSTLTIEEKVREE